MKIELRQKSNAKMKLLVHPDTKLRVRVELTPLGDKIKYRIVGRVVCLAWAGK